MVYDVAIVGARVAGSVLAAGLGELGYNVIVFDRASFPSDTLSTHFFRAPALRAFEKIGVVKEVMEKAPHLKVNYNVIDGMNFNEPVDRPDDYPFYMCVRRITLDAILVDRVREIKNVQLQESTKVIDLLFNSDSHAILKWQKGRDIGETQARVVVGADGLRSFVAKKVKAPFEDQVKVNRAMYFAYYRNVEAKEGPAAEFHYNGNLLGYCFPCDNGYTMVAVSLPIDQFEVFKKNPEKEFQATLNTMTDLGDRVQAGDRQSEIFGTGSIPGYLRIPYGTGWVLVGDAAMVMDPWSGQGIDQATTHSVILSGCLSDYLSGKQDWHTVMADYHKQRNEHSSKAYKRTCGLSVDLRPMTKAALEKRGLA